MKDLVLAVFLSVGAYAGKGEAQVNMATTVAEVEAIVWGA